MSLRLVYHNSVMPQSRTNDLYELTEDDPGSLVPRHGEKISITLYN